ncbi:MAG: hypothetical protein GTO45_05235 [Candidatus Aminicenantes bacterium]|nr:hypothetical protein [Candidatus Aminicenantes bacterium]NIM78155.1 hypothetical protein [Candidatus Aminicenantes bacterium]NIN17479.1 hypothetical protein [Candidatus Aminicenantes bacterium]NIN41375.1 hypothetical protein [Candidatus Aminicenantes bacterium]NIN84141.1 hypothetical protein [Candidatus Aminicenantes bacterium]
MQDETKYTKTLSDFLEADICHILSDCEAKVLFTTCRQLEKINSLDHTKVKHIIFDKYDNLHIKGRSKNMILMSNGENIYPEAIEEKLNASFYVLESLVMENNNQLEAWVYLDYDLIDLDTRGKSEKERGLYIEKILAQIKGEVNEQLSSFSKLSRIFVQQEPFVKTATHKIKRYLYAHPHKKE